MGQHHRRFILAAMSGWQNGVYVGQNLGANAPSPLPTTNKWVRKGAFAITYSIPIPNF
jgi:hypothetical protein